MCIALGVTNNFYHVDEFTVMESWNNEEDWLFLYLFLRNFSSCWQIYTKRQSTNGLIFINIYHIASIPFKKMLFEMSDIFLNVTNSKYNNVCIIFESFIDEKMTCFHLQLVGYLWGGIFLFFFLRHFGKKTTVSLIHK